MFGIHIRMMARLVAGLATAALLAPAGCGQEEVERYEIPKEAAPRPRPRMRATSSDKEAPPRPPPGARATPRHGAATGPLRYRVPEDWTVKPASGMRAASFGAAAGRVDVSVIQLVGSAGGMLANVNRWRNQLGLPPIGETELASLVTAVPVGGQPGQLVDIEGTGEEARRTIVALAQRGNATWFFKLTGPTAAAGAQKAAFLAFLRSVAFTRSQGAAGR